MMRLLVATCCCFSKSGFALLSSAGRASRTLVASPRSRSVHIMKMGVGLDASKIKKGYTVEIDGSLWKILDVSETTGQARQQASTKVKLVNCFNPKSTVEKNFRGSGDVLFLADLDQVQASFSYVEDGYYIFYTVDDFDELRLNAADVPNGDLMPEGLEVQVSARGVCCCVLLD
jgi:translation elongation factor P/translation initiation factor 5A